MKNFDYIKRFERLGAGLFVHFGLYSVIGKGEWYLKAYAHPDSALYASLPAKFKIKKNWAKELVKTAKKAGAKYITITTRHHDGFSLYDTKGLSDYDIMHSAAARDLMREFTDACNAGGIVPFFYHTLLDWHHPDYKENFPAYIDYLIASVELLCTNYGKIGGFWFDGMWDKPDADWQEDRLYAAIRKYQPEAMIINNTGLSAQGKVGHYELDSVTFERGKPSYVDNSDRPRAGEMCQVLNDHWGYAKDDCNYKPIRELIENLIDCRYYNCNFLLNTGLRGDGSVNPLDKCILAEIGKWIKVNKDFIYTARGADIPCEGGYVLEDDGAYYIVVKDVPMDANPNVTLGGAEHPVGIGIPSAHGIWLDSGEKFLINNNQIVLRPFGYGASRSLRVAKINKNILKQQKEI